MIVTLKGRCMGEFFQCDTGETFPLSSYLSNKDFECYVNARISNTGVLTIIRVFWIKEDNGQESQKDS